MSGVCAHSCHQVLTSTLEVWKRDLVDYFIWMVKKDVVTLEDKGSPEALCRAAELKDRLEKLQKKPYHNWYGDELQRFCKFRLLKSQRETSLSPFLEHARAVRTWQSFDYNLWRACQLTPDLPRVVAEELFLEQVKAGKLVLGWSDAVPWWGLLNSARTLHLGPEVQRPEAPGQLRGPDADEARKYRVTLELRQVLKNYCSDTRDPVGIMGKSLLIVGGKHCRLSNISSAGTWKKTEVFWVAGEKVTHHAGASVGNTMQDWRAIRDSPKTAHLLEKLEVMQQPSAVTDSVIFCWIAEAQAEAYGCSLWTRDVCGGAGGGEQCAAAMFAAGQLGNYIAAKMTAVLQPTDTDFAFLLKRYAEESKLQQRAELVAALAQLELEQSAVPLHYSFI